MREPPAAEVTPPPSGAAEATTPGLDLVSPLPPVRSGIADYAADLLPHLAKRTAVRLVHLPGQPLDPALAARYPVIGPEATGEGGRLPLYQMGNNRYHTEVERLALERPGLLVLHDVVLHHFLLDATFNADRLDLYRARLVADHGWIGELAAAPLAWPGGVGDAAQFALPAHRTLVGRQRGVLVHGRWAAGFLAEEVPGLAVRVVPMGVPLPPACDAAVGRAFRRRHGLPETAPLLGSFGFQTPIKRTEVVVRALARRELAGVHLLVVGEASDGVDLAGDAARAGVADRVHVLGFLPFAELEAAIAASALCLNLRYPTAGETSASLLRVMAAGRPAVVSDHAQVSDLPDDVAVKVPLGDGEEEALATRLAALLADPSRLARLGAAARRHVALRHRPEDAADAVVAAARELAGRAPLRPAPASPPPPTTLTWDELDGTIEVAGAELPWPPGERRRLEVVLRNTGRARWLAGERPDGGVALEVEVLAAGRATSRWLPLPTDLGPGEAQRFRFAVRRPLAATRLRLLPQVLGRSGMAALGGPRWELAVPRGG